MAAFGLLSEASDDQGTDSEDAGLSIEELQELAEAVASPLASRSDAQKVVAGLADVGLAERVAGRARLSHAGWLAAQSVGRYEDGFRKLVHALYCWRWQWAKQSAASGPGDTADAVMLATPSWSYRAVCRHILEAGSNGIERDDLVLRVVEDAAPFGASRVSFSRSSVSGVTPWLEAQRPPLITRHGAAIVALSTLAGHGAPTPSTWRLHLASLCREHGGEAVLDTDALQSLSQSLLLSPSSLPLMASAFCDGGEEFLFIRSTPPRLVFRGSPDPLLRWMAGQEPEQAAQPSSATDTDPIEAPH